MRFLVDMALSPQLAAWLRSEGHDAVHAIELGLSQATDTQILHIASEEHRVVVTADLDFPRLIAIFAARQPGLILLRGGNYTESESRACIARVLAAIAHHDLDSSIVVVDHQKIRRRPLPLYH